MYVEALGNKLLIVHGAEAANDLMDRRSSLYSDRPHMIMAGDIVGWDQILVLLRYGSEFREYRRLMARVLGSREAVDPFQGQQH